MIDLVPVRTVEGYRVQRTGVVLQSTHHPLKMRRPATDDGEERKIK